MEILDQDRHEKKCVTFLISEFQAIDKDTMGTGGCVYMDLSILVVIGFLKYSVWVFVVILISET